LFAEKNDDFYKAGREINIKITAGSKIYGRDKIIDFELEYTQDTSKFISSVTGKQLKIKMFDTEYSDTYWLNQEIKVELILNNNKTYVLGDSFKVDTVNRGRQTTEILLTDFVVWKLSDKYIDGTQQDTTTLINLIRKICTTLNVDIALPTVIAGSEEETKLMEMLNMEITNPYNFTYREVLGFIAGTLGCNTFGVNTKGTDGKHLIKLVNMSKENVVASVNKNHYYEFEVDKNKLTINKVNVEIDEGFGYTQYYNPETEASIAGEEDDEIPDFPENEQITVKIPFGNQEIANYLYDTLKGQIQYGYKLKWIGDPVLEPYDLIEVTDGYDGQKYRVRLVSSKLTFTGGLVMECSCTAMTEANTTGSYVENKLGSYIKVLSDKIEMSVNEINETINSVVESSIKATKDNIITEVSATFVTKEEDAEYKNYIASQFSQQKESIDMTFSNVQESLDELNQHKVVSETNINFSEKGITIGKNDSKFKSVFTNEELAFTEDNTKVAYINTNQFFITNGEVTNQMRIGNFVFLPRKNGNTSIKYNPKS
jgi:hypothetical protein